MSASGANLHDTLGIPRRERGAETLQDLKQRRLRLHIRLHDEAFSLFLK